MKKLIAISILLTLLTAAAFAQFTFKISGDFYPALLKTELPTGDAAEPDTTKTYGASSTRWSGGVAADGSQNTVSVPYGGKGILDILTTEYLDVNALNVTFGYTERDQARYGGTIQLNMNALVKRGLQLLEKQDVSAPSGAGTGNINGVSFIELIDSGIGDWNLWGKVGILKGFVGNTGDQGALANYRYDGKAFNFLLNNSKVDNYGIIVPSYTGAVSATTGTVYLGTIKHKAGVPTIGSALDVDNLQTYPKPSATGASVAASPYFSVTADVAPVKVAVAGDLSNVTGIANADPEGYSKVGAAIRVSSDKIADLVAFDAIYKIYGGNFSSEDRINAATTSQATQPAGDGIWGHNFGLYAHAGILNDTLGIGVGYSGLATSREKVADNSKAIASVGLQRDTSSVVTGDATFAYPYFNGIDLRFNFSGVDKLNVTFNNNISFSTMKGDDDYNTVRTGLKGTGLLGTGGGYFTGGNLAPTLNLTDSDQSEGYLALYNALGVKFQLSDQLYVIGELANRLYSYTGTQKVNTGKGRSSEFKLQEGADRFAVGLGAGYALGDHVSFDTGLVFQVDSFSREGTTGVNGYTGDYNYDYGAFTFAIPIHFHVALP